MYIESQDGILASGALKPSNLSLQLELRRWGFPRLVLFMYPLCLFGRRFGWLLLLLLLLLRCRRQRTLMAGWEALVFGVRLGRSGLFGRWLGCLRDGACRVGPSVLVIACTEATLILEAIARAEGGTRGVDLASKPGYVRGEAGAALLGWRAGQITPWRIVDGVLRVVY
jgi:hypothetical protein